jgi:hypothetical protein
MWVVDKDGKAEFRPVTLGDWYGDDVFVDAGLRAGDQVVTDGLLSVRQGEPVKIKPATEVPVPEKDTSGTKPQGTAPAVKIETVPTKPAAAPEAKTAGTAAPSKPAAKPVEPGTPAKPAAKPASSGGPGGTQQGR